MMFDWDDLELDNTATHNSLMFFAQRRLKHEKKAEEEKDFERHIDELAILTETVKVCEVKKEVNEFSENSNKNCENKENEAAVEENHNVPQPKRIMNLVTPSRFGNAANAAVPKRIFPAGPSERLIAIPNKREQLLQEQIEKEKKMREFHSRPMPKFKVPTKIKKHEVTVPKTPVVVKRSKESQLKRLEKIKEIEKNSKPLPFKAHAADVVKEAPFVPKKVPTTLEVRPYNLRSEQRLAERKKYDDAVQRALDEKKKQVDTEKEEQKRLEEERYKEIRKATTFKARPNPFK